MPEKLFIGLDRPVPPIVVPAARPGCIEDRSSALSDCSRYQPAASWHQVQKAVDMQVWPTRAIARTAAPIDGVDAVAAR